MNEAVELHDSEIRCIRREGHDVILELSLYLLVSQGRPGMDRGTGWEQDAELIISDARIQQTPDSDYMWILDGRVEVGSDTFDNLLPLPFDHSGPVTVRLNGAEGSFVASGRHAKVVLKGLRRFIEEYGGAV